MRSHAKKRKVLWSIHIILIFTLSFIVGAQFAKAQYTNPQTIPYFDLPGENNTDAQAQTFSGLTSQTGGDGKYVPATAEFPEFKDQVTITAVPEIPKPGEEIVVSLEVYSFDINTAQITWSIDGKVSEKGVGLKRFSFTNKISGEKTTLTALIEPGDRPSLTKTLIFSGGEVDILWQADVYTPPFYKGKSLYTPESKVLFVALPRNNAGFIEPNNTVFNWRVNYNADDEKSGLGRNTFEFEGPIILRPIDVTVEVYEGSEKNALASSNLTLEHKFPVTLFYENHPLYGVLFNRNLSKNITLVKNELGLSAYPYFQTALNKNTSLKYRWGIDGYVANVPENQNTITLRKNNTNEGESFVELEVENPNKILQSSKASLGIQFDTTSDTTKSEFGL